MGWFGKSNYEKHEKKLDKKTGKIIKKLEIPDLRVLCKNLIGSFPRNKLELLDKDGNVVMEYKDPISRNDYYTFYSHYQDLEEVNDIMLAKYLIKIRKFSKHDEDFVYLDTHDKDDDDDVGRKHG